MNVRGQSLPEALQTTVARLVGGFSHVTLQRDLLSIKALHHVALLENCLHIELRMPFAWRSGFEALERECTPLLLQDATLRQAGVARVEWKLNTQVATLKPAKDLAPVGGVKNIIAVSSGKGGVGKSSTAVNLALALAAEGAKAGILDADIYGPSVPAMLGTKSQHPGSPDGSHISPIMAHGVASNSIGYLASDDNAMIWRGPMACKALLQLLQETLWPTLDYLVIDLPPGTGDIQLTLAQSIPVTGAVIVTTPQDIALLDARKGIVMFEKVAVPVLGVVENMSVHICQQCGHHEAIFGSGGASRLCEQYHCALLAQLPLHISLREDLDAGRPTVVSRPDSEFTRLYRSLAMSVAAGLYWQGEVVPDSIAFRAL